jgi:hypothetical protein
VTICASAEDAFSARATGAPKQSQALTSAVAMTPSTHFERVGDGGSARLDFGSINRA